MDPIEKKINELYRQKKLVEEKSIPGFDTFWDKLGHVQNVKPKHSHFFFRIAAAVIFVLAAGSYYFYSSRWAARETVKIFPLNVDQNPSIQSLVDKNAGTNYIWNWKAPTDKLLNDATKSSKTPIKI